MDNHSSANEYAQEVDAFLCKEMKEGALFGPFDEEPHPAFTWAPLMTRPKGSGRRVILDLTYGDHSVNNYTDKCCYDGTPFSLTLPTLDALIPTLRDLGIRLAYLRLTYLVPSVMYPLILQMPYI